MRTGTFKKISVNFPFDYPSKLNFNWGVCGIMALYRIAIKPYNAVLNVITEEGILFEFNPPT